MSMRWAACERPIAVVAPPSTREAPQQAVAAHVDDHGARKRDGERPTPSGLANDDWVGTPTPEDSLGLAGRSDEEGL